MTDDDLPALHADADAASRRGQRRYFRATRGTLLAGIFSAIFGAIDLRHGGTDWAGVVATIAFAAAIFVGIYLLSEHPEREWYEGRAAAESTKTLAWRYSVGASDFAEDDENADREFLKRIRSLAQGLRHVALGRHPDREEITAGMRSLRSRTFVQRRDTYRRDRIEDQEQWYSDSATKHANLALTWRLISLAAQFVGLVGGILKATETIDFDLLGIAAAAGAAAVAWLATREHGTLATAYANTARELTVIKNELESTDEPDWPAAVDNAELAISREHTLWKARRVEFDAG
jgi:hypothetical protein